MQNFENTPNKDPGPTRISDWLLDQLKDEQRAQEKQGKKKPTYKDLLDWAWKTARATGSRHEPNAGTMSPKNGGSTDTSKSSIENEAPSAPQSNSASELHQMADRAAATLSLDRVMRVLRAIWGEEEEGGTPAAGARNPKDPDNQPKTPEALLGVKRRDRTITPDVRRVPGRPSGGHKKGS